MYNKVFLVGNLARDPELRFTPAGVATCRFAIACNRPKNKETGESEADFINVIAWRRLAEICGEYLKKGRPVAVEGKLQVRAYTGKDGQPRTMTEVVLDNMQMLGKREDSKTESAKDEAPF